MTPTSSEIFGFRQKESDFFEQEVVKGVPMMDPDSFHILGS